MNRPVNQQQNLTQKINVVPFEKTEVNTITNISIHITKVDLFKEVVLAIRFYNVAGIVISVEALTVSGEDYAKWGNDDNYLYDYVSAKLNITILNRPPPPFVSNANQSDSQYWQNN